MPENMATNKQRMPKFFLFEHLLQIKRSFQVPRDPERYKAFSILCLHLYCIPVQYLQPADDRRRWTTPLSHFVTHASKHQPTACLLARFSALHVPIFSAKNAPEWRILH